MNTDDGTAIYQITDEDVNRRVKQIATAKGITPDEYVTELLQSCDRAGLIQFEVLEDFEIWGCGV